MNKLIFIFACSMFSVNVFCQTLTQANAGMAVGDIIKCYVADSTAVNHTNSGPSASWNFSNVTVTTTESTTIVAAPSATPYASSFPSASIACIAASGQYAYYISNSSEITLLGVVTTNATLVYSNTQKMYQFPISYGSTFTDNLACNYTMSSIPFQRTGTVTCLADAKGTLVLNGTTYSNVLRLKYIQNITDVCSYYTMEQTLTSFMWYDCIHKTPVLNICYSYVDYDGMISESKAAYVADFASDIDYTFYSEKLNVDVFPNPVAKGNDLSVQIINDNYLNSLNYNITDISGRVVLKGETEPGAMDLNINTEPLNSGVYFLNVSSDNGVVVRKFVVE